MFWVVQENIRQEAQHSAFVDVLRNHNIDHAIVKIIPFIYETEPVVNPTGKVTVIGSVIMDSLAKRKGWTPGSFINDNHDQRVWTEAYGRQNVLNSDVEFYEFSKIPRFEGRKFIRPVSDKKQFDGTIVHIEEIEEWQNAIQFISEGESRLVSDTIVGVSSILDIEMEWRFFVVNGQVLAGSRYRQWGLSDHRRVDNTTDAWRYAQTMVDLWKPAQAFVIDIAKLHKGDYKVIEINCINAAGFYACDMEPVILAINSL